jgi:carboxypeptidase T
MGFVERTEALSMTRLPIALAAAALVAATLPASAHPGDTEHRALRAAERQQTGLYRAWFPDLATGRKAAVTYHAQLVESAWQRGFLVLELGPAEIAALQGFGFRVVAAPDVVARRNRFLDQVDAAGNGVQAIPGYECYETVEETFAAAAGIAATKPQLATWTDVGDSWTKTQGLGGYDLKVLKLTNSAVGGTKPRLFINAAIHAREYTTAPLVLAFARWLSDGHGVDPDATWILDHHEVHLLLQANPDGRKKAEAGLSWRKNTNSDYCVGNSIGADLNRNFTYHWNITGGVGSSGNPCDLTYRGPEPASEPETQAIEAYIRGLWPDRRGPGLNDPAPPDTSGIHLDIHSYSELVLWPWGTTNAPAPNGTALQTLGRRFAWFNGYTPMQSIGLYPTDGTSDGPSYGELGVAAYTFELGTSFFQSCSVYNDTIKPDNLPALVYAAKVVRTPYLTPAGPDTQDVALTPSPVPTGGSATLTARVTDTRFNQSNGNEPVQAIAGADAYIGTPPWAPGAVAIPLAAADGRFDSSTEAVTGSLSTVGLPDGRHLVYVVGRDAAGASGPVSAGWLDVGVAPPGITLTLSKTPGSRRSTVNLAWDGADGRRVDLYRGGALLLSTRNDGAYSQRVPAGTWTYRVCEQGSNTVCSVEQSITTP